MNKKIIGVTVGTSINPDKIGEKLKAVKTVNGKKPDKTGNVQLDPLGTNLSEEQIQSAVNKYLEEHQIDLSGAVKFDGTQELTEEQKAQARANIGALSIDELPRYDGEYEVTPSTASDQMLKTAQKYVDADMKINKIPYAEVTNTSNGLTVTIGTEV